MALLALALAGCLGQSVEPAVLPAPVEVSALHVGEAVRIDAEQPAREPAIVQAPDGALYVAGFWGFARVAERPGTPQNLLQGPLAWKSTDAGATWQRLEPGTALQGAVSNSDLDLAAAADGTLYLASLSYYSVPLPAGLPVAVDPATTLAVVVGATRDGGATWTWTRLDAGPERSHPWVASAPDGTAHVVWGTPEGIAHARSGDAGATWQVAGLVHSAGAAGGIVASPRGPLAVRVSPGGAATAADGVAVSEDGGATWALRSVPGDRGGDAPRGFDPVAFDGAGALFAVWSEGQAIRLAHSPDLGRTWHVADVAAEPDGTLPYDTYLRGGPAGEVAATWYALTGETVAARAARVRWGAPPEVRLGTFSADTGGTNHADYYQVAFLHDGTVAAAVPVSTPDLGQWLDYRAAR
jgi:hypothetical protein